MSAPHPSPKTGPQFQRLAAHYGQRQSFNYHFHVAPDHGFIYVTNPKVACSSTKATLNLTVAADMGRDDFKIENMPQVHKRAHNVLRRPIDLPHRFERMITDPAVLRFTFVRDPVARFCSAFLSKLSGKNPNSNIRRRLWTHMGWDAARESSLEEFAELCASDPFIREFDPHWQPQRRQIAFDLVDYGFIGDHSRFEEQFAGVLRRLFRREVEIFDSRKSFSRPTGAAKVATGLSARFRQNIETAYAQDFEMIAEIEARGLGRLSP